jgi:hypothetical protein
MLAEREEIDTNYMWVHYAGNKKKADVKTLESVTKLTDDDIRKIITDKLAKKEPMLLIKVNLMEEHDIDEERYSNIMIEFIKQRQQNTVEELKKKNAFIPELSEEDRKKLEEAKKGTPTPKGAAAPGKGAAAPAGGKKDEGKKKK